MKPLEPEGVKLLDEFERHYRKTKRALLQSERYGFSGKQTPRKDLIVLGERLRAIGAGFRPDRRNRYYMVVVDGLLEPCNPWGAKPSAASSRNTSSNRQTTQARPDRQF